MWRAKSATCAALAAMLMLTACCSACRCAPAFGRMPQPPYLLLEAGQTYTPARAEKWASPAVLQAKDEIILELSNALERAGLQPFLPRP